MNFTELDALVAAAPNAKIKSALFTELKGNITEAANSGGITSANEIKTQSLAGGTFAGDPDPVVVTLVSAIDSATVAAAFLFISIKPTTGKVAADYAAIGTFWSEMLGSMDNEDGTWTYAFNVYNTGSAGIDFCAIPVFELS